MGIAIAVLALEGLIFLGVLGLIIYFIIQRIENKKEETFEDRDN